MARRVIIELEDSEYLELVELYKEFQKNNPQLAGEVKFEDFVTSIIRTNLEAKRQMDKMGDGFKSMMEMFNSADMEAVLKSFSKTFASAAENSAKEAKKEAPATESPKANPESEPDSHHSQRESSTDDDDDSESQKYKS